MKTTAIDYACDGVSMTGWLVDGANADPAPGVLVVHEVGGLGDHARRRAEALAEAGYVAFALDLYGDDTPADPRSGYDQMMSTPGLMAARAIAALDVLRARPGVDAGRLAVVGFCLGGVVALELARLRPDLRCAVGLHPSLQRPAGSVDAAIAASVLMIVGSDDPFVSEADRARFGSEMTASGADWRLLLLGDVGHSFTNPAVDALDRPGLRYDERADRRAWASTLGAVEEAFTTGV